MSLTLRVRMITPQGVGATKAMRFAENMTVPEACATIEEKTGMGGKDHGIFIPLNEDSGTLGGRWMKNDRRLEYYDMSANALVDYRKKHDTVRVKLIDGTQKTCLVDFSADVSAVVEQIANKIGLKGWEEYSLMAENVEEWMEPDASLLEQMPSEKDLVRLKKKYYVSDTNVDRDDPVHLHFVYAQSKDDVLRGKLVTTKDEAIQLAAILCQVDFGTMSAQSSVVVKTCMAERWHKEKGLDKLVAVEWKKLAGMNDVNAKYRYIQFCRSLKTYGITLYTVQERIKGSKKMAKKLLGMTRDSIIKMSIDCKVVEKTWPIKHLKRWAASGQTFTLDFGAHEDDYVTVITEEGEEMSKLIGGYIDLLLKKQSNTEVATTDDGGAMADVTDMARLGGQGSMAQTVSVVGGGAVSLSASVRDVDTAANAVDKMINQLFGEIAAEEGGVGLSAAQRLKQLGDHERNLGGLASRLVGLVTDPNGVDKAALDQVSRDAAHGIEALVKAARTACAAGLDPDGALFEGVKGLAECLQTLLSCAAEVEKNPTDQAAKNRLADAHAAVQATLLKLGALENGARADEAYQRLLTEMAKSANSAAQRMHAQAGAFALGNEAARPQVTMANEQLSVAGQALETMAKILAPAATDEGCKQQVVSSAERLRQAAEFLRATLSSAGLGPDDTAALQAAMMNLNGVLANLLSATEIPAMAGSVKGASEFSAAAHTITDACTALMASLGQGGVIKQNVGIVETATAQLQGAVAVLGQNQDPADAARLKDYAEDVRRNVAELVGTSPPCLANPSDEVAHAKLRAAAQLVMDATATLTGDAGSEVAVAALFDAAKFAAATGTALVSASYGCAGKVSDPTAEANMLGASAAVADAASQLLEVLKQITDASNPQSASALVGGAEAYAPKAYKLIAAAKSAGVRVTDPNAKRELAHSADLAAKAVHKLLLHRKGIKALAGQGDMLAAGEQLAAHAADIEAALLAAQSNALDPASVSREVALRNLNGAVKGMATLTKEMSVVARDSPENLGPTLQKVAAGVGSVVACAKELAATADDPQVARNILLAAKRLVDETNKVAGTARALAAKPNDENLSRLLAEAGREVAQSLAGLVQASRAVIPQEIVQQQKKAGEDMEALAEKELQGAAAEITRAVERLKAAQAAARERAQQPDFNIDEGNITEAILAACTAIGQSTGALIGAATKVQSEFNALMVKPDTAAVYKRDPKWAKGLISASHEVAASVGHLVTVADGAAKGEAVEEALQVAASQVSAATAHLVAASSVKQGVNASSQAGLSDAAKAVTAATKSLVQAAKDAANFRDEVAASSGGGGQDFNLSQSKIAEMEEQMAILKLERELERKRQALLAKRKDGYADAGKQPAAKAPAAAAPPAAAGTAGAALPPPPAGATAGAALPPPPAGAAGGAALPPPPAGAGGPPPVNPRGRGGPMRGRGGPKRGMGPGRGGPKRGMARGRGMPPPPGAGGLPPPPGA